MVQGELQAAHLYLMHLYVAMAARSSGFFRTHHAHCMTGTGCFVQNDAFKVKCNKCQEAELHLGPESFKHQTKWVGGDFYKMFDPKCAFSCFISWREHAAIDPGGWRVLPLVCLKREKNDHRLNWLHQSTWSNLLRRRRTHPWLTSHHHPTPSIPVHLLPSPNRLLAGESGVKLVRLVAPTGSSTQKQMRVDVFPN